MLVNSVFFTPRCILTLVAIIWTSTYPKFVRKTLWQQLHTYCGFFVTAFEQVVAHFFAFNFILLTCLLSKKTSLHSCFFALQYIFC